MCPTQASMHPKRTHFLNCTAHISNYEPTLTDPKSSVIASCFQHTSIAICSQSVTPNKHSSKLTHAHHASLATQSPSQTPHAYMTLAPCPPFLSLHPSPRFRNAVPTPNPTLCQRIPRSAPLPPPLPRAVHPPRHRQCRGCSCLPLPRQRPGLSDQTEELGSAAGMALR